MWGCKRYFSVPVMLQPGHDLLRMLHTILAPRQVNFLAHVQELAASFSETELLSDINPAFTKRNPANLVYGSNTFWGKKRISVPDAEIQMEFSHPKCLLLPGQGYSYAM